MLKGAQKRMVVVRTGTSTLFEAAYFVLRDDAPEENRPSMLEEANRILDESFSPRPTQTPPKSRKEQARALLCLALGLLLGALLGGGIVLLFGF